MARGYSALDTVIPGPYLGSYASLAGALMALLLGAHAWWKNPGSALHRAFAAFALTIAVWEGGFVVVNAGTDKQAVWLAYRIASLGFCLLPAAATALVLRLCEIRNPWRFVLPLSAMGLVFLVRSWTGVLYVRDFVLTPGGNGYLHATDSPWYWLFNLTYLIHGTNLFLLARRWITVKGRRLRRQAAVLTLSYAVTALLHLAQSSVPSMTGVDMPWLVTVLPANALVLAWQAWAMARYRFLGLEAAWVDAQVLKAVEQWGSPPADRLGLDEEEKTLARWAAEGLSNKDIALRLGLAEGTVKNKMSTLLARVGARNRSELRRRLG